MNISWDQRIDRFWDRIDESRPKEMFAEMEDLVSEYRGEDGAATYEWASVHDSFGVTDKAIDLYRSALSEGLDEMRAPQAMLQLASSLRAEGRPQDCLDVLDDFEATAADASAVIGDAHVVVRSLALHDLGREDEALRGALLTIASTLPRYQRSMTAYADELTAQ